MKVNELVEGGKYKDKYGNIYTIKDGRFLLEGCYEDWIESCYTYNQLVDLEFTECEFEPEDGELYWYPHFYCSDGWARGRWYAADIDKSIKRNVGVYRTKEQALEKAKELGWVEEERDETMG